MEKVNWDEVGPNDVTIDELENADESDFPHTYSGNAWWAAWVMYHKEHKANQDEFLTKGGWSEFPALSKELRGRARDLTGFMVGWACNAIRYLLYMPPVSDGAIIIIGGGTRQLVGIPLANAKKSMEVAITGKNEGEDK